MAKVINVVDKNNGLIASISDENIILHNDYKVIETNEDEAFFCGCDGDVEIIKPEITI